MYVHDVHAPAGSRVSKMKYLALQFECIQSVDWTSGLDYWTQI